MRSFLFVFLFCFIAVNAQNGIHTLNDVSITAAVNISECTKIEKYNDSYYYINKNNEVFVTSGTRKYPFFNLKNIKDMMLFNGKLYFLSGAGFSFEYDKKTLKSLLFDGIEVCAFNKELCVNFGEGFYFPLSSNTNKITMPTGNAPSTIWAAAVAQTAIFILNENGLYKFNGKDYTFISKQIFYQKWKTVFKQQMSMKADAAGNVYLVGKNKDGITELFIKKYNNDTFMPVSEFISDLCFNRLNSRIGFSTLIKKNEKVYAQYNNLLFEFDGNGYKLHYLCFNSYPLVNPAYASEKVVVIQSNSGIYLNYQYPREFIPEEYSYPAFKKFCEDSFSLYASDKKTLGINNVVASVSNIGNIFDKNEFVFSFINNETFWLDLGENFTHKNYLCKQFIFTAALWMGGLNAENDSVQTAISQYHQRGRDFYAGAITNKTLTPVNNDNLKKIHMITKREIAEFKENRLKLNYKLNESIKNWPGKKSISQETFAPFEDINGNGIYDPENGDFPKIKGDMYSWCVFHDVGAHTESSSDSMGLEIEQEVFEYYNINENNDSTKLLNNTIFISYSVKNKSRTTYNDFVIGKFVDCDNGNYADDLVACDTASNTVWTYNGYDDDLGVMGLGLHPPFLGYTSLNEKLHVVNGNSSSDPLTTIKGDYKKVIYKSLIGKMYNEPITKFNNQPYFRFPVIPFTKNAESIVGRPTDKRLTMALKPRILKPDSIVKMDFAVFFNFPKDATDSNEFINSINKSKLIQYWYKHNSYPNNSYYPLNISKINNKEIRIYPNPGDGNFNIVGPSKIENILVHDAIGNVIYMKKCNSNVENVQLHQLKSGLYFIEIMSNGTKNIVKYLVE